ncbi:unnamed protein product, partial [Heterotrigona itama]
VLLLINATTSRPPALAVRIRQEPLDNDNLSDRPGTLSVSQYITSKKELPREVKVALANDVCEKQREQRPAIMAAYEPAFIPDLFRRYTPVLEWNRPAGFPHYFDSQLLPYMGIKRKRLADWSVGRLPARFSKCRFKLYDTGSIMPSGSVH